MEDYSELEKYIQKSKLITITDYFKIRLSDDLLKKYEQGSYDPHIAYLLSSIRKIRELNIVSPGIVDPIFYFYVIPDENFAVLLNYPTCRKGGRKPTRSYETGGFEHALGMKSSMLQEDPTEYGIDFQRTTLHELAHLLHGHFGRQRYLKEGFAEVIPLYVLDLEEKSTLHRKCLLSLADNQILTAQQLIELCRNDTYNGNPVIPSNSRSFDIACLSSYLFVRGCIEKIKEDCDCNKVQATQQFVNIVTDKGKKTINELLVCEMAEALHIPQDELLNGKTMQYKALNSIAGNSQKTPHVK